jgi:hypothetical protein
MSNSYNSRRRDVRKYVLLAVTVRITVFWDVTPQKLVPTFRSNMLSPSSGIYIGDKFGEKDFNLKMEADNSSESLVTI